MRKILRHPLTVILVPAGLLNLGACEFLESDSETLTGHQAKQNPPAPPAESETSGSQDRLTESEDESRSQDRLLSENNHPKTQLDSQDQQLLDVTTPLNSIDGIIEETENTKVHHPDPEKIAAHVSDCAQSLPGKPENFVFESTGVQTHPSEPKTFQAESTGVQTHPSEPKTFQAESTGVQSYPGKPEIPKSKIFQSESTDPLNHSGWHELLTAVPTMTQPDPDSPKTSQVAFTGPQIRSRWHELLTTVPKEVSTRPSEPKTIQDNFIDSQALSRWRELLTAVPTNFQTHSGQPKSAKSQSDDSKIHSGWHELLTTVPKEDQSKSWKPKKSQDDVIDSQVHSRWRELLKSAPVEEQIVSGEAKKTQDQTKGSQIHSGWHELLVAVPTEFQNHSNTPKIFHAESSVSAQNSPSGYGGSEAEPTGVQIHPDKPENSEDEPWTLQTRTKVKNIRYRPGGVPFHLNRPETVDDEPWEYLLRSDKPLTIEDEPWHLQNHPDVDEIFDSEFMSGHIHPTKTRGSEDESWNDTRSPSEPESSASDVSCSPLRPGTPTIPAADPADDQIYFSNPRTLIRDSNSVLKDLDKKKTTPARPTSAGTKSRNSKTSTFGSTRSQGFDSDSEMFFTDSSGTLTPGSEQTFFANSTPVTTLNNESEAFTSDDASPDLPQDNEPKTFVDQSTQTATYNHKPKTYVDQSTQTTTHNYEPKTFVAETTHAASYNDKPKTFVAETNKTTTHNHEPKTLVVETTHAISYNDKPKTFVAETTHAVSHNDEPKTFVAETTHATSYNDEPKTFVAETTHAISHNDKPHNDESKTFVAETTHAISYNDEPKTFVAETTQTISHNDEPVNLEPVSAPILETLSELPIGQDDLSLVLTDSSDNDSDSDAESGDDMDYIAERLYEIYKESPVLSLQFLMTEYPETDPENFVNSTLDALQEIELASANDSPEPLRPKFIPQPIPSPVIQTEPVFNPRELLLDLESLTSSFDSCKAELSDAYATLSEKNEEIDFLKLQAIDFRDYISNGIPVKFKNEIADLKSDLKTLETKHSRLKEKYQTATEDIYQLKLDLDHSEETRIAVQSELDTQNERLEILANGTMQLQEQFQDADEKSGQLHASQDLQIRNLKQEKADMEEEFRVLLDNQSRLATQTFQEYLLLTRNWVSKTFLKTGKTGQPLTEQEFQLQQKWSIFQQVSREIWKDYSDNAPFSHENTEQSSVRGKSSQMTDFISSELSYPMLKGGPQTLD